MIKLIAISMIVLALVSSGYFKSVEKHESVEMSEKTKKKIY